MEGLNDAQHAAVTAPHGPLMIIAGPGTGKTKTLTARIAYLIQKRGQTPRSIVALTFTNKAAAEMRERVQAVLGNADLPVIGTFHAFALRLLEDLRGTTEIAFVGEPERLQIVRSLKKSQQYRGHSARELALLISRAKNGAAASSTIQPLVNAYNLELAARHLRDFDDVLLELRDALQDDKLRSRVQLRYRTFLVDEFQDTNALQYELLQLLNSTDDLWVIGDPRQSIYGFRGAGGDVFGQFAQDFPMASTITLTTNYRSQPEIVAATNAIFADAPQLNAYRNASGMVQVVEVLNEYSEASWVVEHIQAAVGGSDMLTGSQHHTSDQARTFGDFAVLYRSRSVARAVQKALETSGIPYQVAGEGSPFEQPAVQAVLEALRYLAQGSTYKHAPLLTKVKNQIAGLALPQLTTEIIAALQLENDKTRATLRQFQNSLLCCNTMTITEYLEHVGRIAEQQFYDPAADAVALMTIHASKGLEFPYVFLLAAEDGVLPYRRKGESPDLAEERRLFYVAVSRAAEALDIIYTQKRAGEPTKRSSFLQGLPVQHILDPQLEANKRTAERRRQKRVQTSLF